MVDTENLASNNGKLTLDMMYFILFLSNIEYQDGHKSYIFWHLAEAGMPWAEGRILLRVGERGHSVYLSISAVSMQYVHLWI